MSFVGQVLVGLIALLHFYILVLEMFLWTTPRGLKAFGQTLESAKASKALAANQGLYNGFLAVGLVWGLLHPDRQFAWELQMFFLACVAIAGIYGAITAKRSILFVQTVPAVIAMIVVTMAIYLQTDLPIS